MHEPHIVHPFMFPLTRDTDYWKLHWFRDGTAIGHVLWALAELGFRRGYDLVNRPETAWPGGFLSEQAARQLLLVGTRPPISDGDQRKVIERSGCEIEHAIFNRLLAYFTYLERGRVILTREMREALERRNRTDIQYVYYGRQSRFFRDYFAETDSERRRVEDTSNWRTYGYVVRDRLWIDGPEVLAFFGIDGETTLAFAHLLRTRHSALLNGRGLSIVELKGMIPPNASTLEFVDGWETKVILDRAATVIAPPRTRREATRPAPRCGPDFLDAFTGQFGAPTPPPPAP